MSLSVKILAVISSFTLLLGAAVPRSSEAVQVSRIEISADPVGSSAEEAALQMRKALKAHTSEIIINVDNVSFSSDKTERQAQMQALSQSMMYKAFDETGSGTEGDYLRFAVRSYKCSVSTSGRLTYTVYYYTTAEEEAVLTKKLNEIMNSLNVSGMSDYNKISTIYKYANSHLTYSDDLDDPYVYSAYNAVLRGDAVCQGIAQLLYRMYNDSGIPCRIIAGYSHDLSGVNPNGNHVWLIVKLDGIYYLLDPTWDLRSKNGNYRYFLKGTADFDSDAPQLVHVAQNDNGLTFPDYNSDEFHTAYPISKYRYSPVTYTLGDVNGDKLIDSVDASLILAEYTRLSSQETASFSAAQSKCADVNNDSKIDSVDASRVLAYYALISNGADISLADYIKTH